MVEEVVVYPVVCFFCVIIQGFVGIIVLCRYSGMIVSFPVRIGDEKNFTYQSKKALFHPFVFGSSGKISKITGNFSLGIEFCFQYVSVPVFCRIKKMLPDAGGLFGKHLGEYIICNERFGHTIGIKGKPRLLRSSSV